jgi:pterin-4a-carbinolamine dehydratase
MISMSNIMTYAFTKLCMAILSEIKCRYKEKECLDIFIKHAEHELREDLAMDSLSDTEDTAGLITAENFTALDNGGLLSSLSGLKHQMDSADYLFLKALFVESEQDALFLLQQAQMISPENIRLYVLISFIENDNADAGDVPCKDSRQLTSFAHLTDDAAVRDFIFLLILDRSMKEKMEGLSPLAMANFLNRVSLPLQARYSLLYEISERIATTDVKVLLQHLQLPKQEQNWVFRLLSGNVSFYFEDYKNALDLYSRVDIDDEEVDYYQEIEVLYKQAVSYWETGNEGKAILQWRDILFSGNYDQSYSAFYYHAMVDLARHYVRMRDNREAGRVLSKLDADMIEFIEDVIGEDYFLLIAEKALLETDYEKALIYFEKANKANEREETTEKIRKLREDNKA